MPAITFRFTTECEMTLRGDSYETIYLQFKDFMHKQRPIRETANVKVFPPEREQMFFRLDDDVERYEIPAFKGAFKDDILRHCKDRPLKHEPPFSMAGLSQRVKTFIPDFYW